MIYNPRFEIVAHYYIGCKGKGKEGTMVYTLTGVEYFPNNRIEMKFRDAHNFPMSLVDGFTPLLYPVDEITHDHMVRILKEVSLIDLVDCLFITKEQNSDKGAFHTRDKITVFAHNPKNMAVVDAMEFDGNIFRMMANDGSFHVLNPMSQAMALMYEFGYDMYNLINSGHALDANAHK